MDKSRRRYFFPSEIRIKKRAEFLRIQESGRKYRSNHFILIVNTDQKSDDVSPSRHKPSSRIGVTVTTKIDKRAVGRNLIKRRWREFFRLRVHRIRPAMSLVLIALQGSSELSHDEFVREATFLFHKAHLFTQNVSAKHRAE